MSMALDFTVRILVAALVGGVIGYERELRGKVAGIRTHLLVALGACLFMIISQYGFTGADKFDAARVAASVVGGLGFLGGGIIMKNRHVSGLTTAAGIWVTGAIGMTAGAAMYELTVLGSLLLLLCAEAAHHLDVKLGERQVNVVLSAKERKDMENAIRALGKQVAHFSWSKESGGYKADLGLLVKKKAYPEGLLKQIGELHGIELQSLD
ncbi:MAG: MgtC/SapB family protein [Bacteroidales bacterium]|nr:MgtC/SapB family protein [Bacteroidales bacterium]